MDTTSLPFLQTKGWLTLGRGPTDVTRVRVCAAHDEWNHVGITLAAMAEGFLALEGLAEVELVTVPESSGELLDREAMQVEMLATGAADIGVDPRTTFVLEAKSAGRPVCIVAARRKNHAFVVFGRKGLASIEDLRGMTIDMGTEGGATDVMLRQVCIDTGLQPGRDVHVEYLGGAMHDSAGTIGEFRAGRRPVILVSYPDEIANLIGEGYPVLADLRTRYPSRHDRVTAANSDFAARHPDLLEAFLRGMIRACNFVIDLNNGPRFKEIMLGAGFLTSEREQANFDGLLQGWQERVSRDLALPRDGIELIVDEEQRAGKLPASFAVDDVLSLDALVRAQATLGLEPIGV